VRTSTKSAVAVQFDPHWQTIMECAALEVFEMMANARLEISATPGSPQPEGGLTAMVGMAGALCGMTTIRCSPETAAKLAALMLGEQAASNPSTSCDALGELCNMVAGNFKAKVSTLGEHCFLSVPTVIRGESYSLGTAEPVESINVVLNYSGQPIYISLVVDS
jgi:chemotaxis protein CheX